MKELSADGIGSGAVRTPLPNNSIRHDIDFFRSQADNVFEPRRNISKESATKGALKSRIDPVTGDAQIGSMKMGKTEWMNESKQVKEFAPKELIKDLTVKGAAKTIVKRLLGPKAQILMAADDVIGGVTGERLSSCIGRGFKTNKEQEIRRRLEMGQRVIPMGLGF